MTEFFPNKLECISKRMTVYCEREVVKKNYLLKGLMF